MCFNYWALIGWSRIRAHLKKSLPNISQRKPKLRLRMVSKAGRFEILLGFTILINVYVLLVVLNNQKNEVASELKSKAQLMGRLNELQKVLHVRQDSPIRVNSQHHEEEGNEKDNADRWNNWEGNDWKSANNTRSSSKKPVLSNYCPEGGASLEGQRTVNVKKIQDSLHLLDALSVDNGGNVKFGGWWKPEHCNARADVAILIPYRKRDTQLQMFLHHMHPILQRQLLSYRIFVIEQAGDAPWNKGAIYNIGFNTILKIDKFDCFIFHDVDLLLENDKNYYGCNFTPAHLSVAVDTLKYKLNYGGLFGGVQAFSKEDYININGYSNMYWGWGAEDDDLYTRVVERKYKVYRPDMKVGRYTMNQLDHFRSDGRNVKNIKMYRDVKARMKLMNVDGLNKVNSLLYNYKVQEEPLLTRILISLQRYRELKV